LDALKLALRVGKPAIINSDQGCQFTSIVHPIVKTKFSQFIENLHLNSRLFYMNS
jgi:hypothetical protein